VFWSYKWTPVPNFPNSLPPYHCDFPFHFALASGQLKRSELCYCLLAVGCLCRLRWVLSLRLGSCIIDSVCTIATKMNVDNPDKYGTVCSITEHGYCRRGLKSEAMLHNWEKAEDMNRRYIKKEAVFGTKLYMWLVYAAYVNMGVRACTYTSRSRCPSAYWLTHTLNVILLFVRSLSLWCICGFCAVRWCALLSFHWYLLMKTRSSVIWDAVQSGINWQQKNWKK